MKKIFNKNNVINFICLLVIVSAVFFGYRATSGGSFTSGSNSSALPDDFPTLKAFDLLPSNPVIDEKTIRIALKPNKNVNEANAVADIIELYRWGRSQWGDAKQNCGDDYRESLCTYGNVEIAIVKVTSRRDLMGSPYSIANIIYFSWLDQVQIDYLLKSQQLPSSLDEIVTFHDEVLKLYKGTAGFAFPSQSIKIQSMPFNGWDEFLYELRSNGAPVP